MKRYGSRREDNQIGQVGGLPEVVHGTKSSRRRAGESFLQAMRECTCVHGISIAKPCAPCDFAADMETEASERQSNPQEKGNAE